MNTSKERRVRGVRVESENALVNCPAPVRFAKEDMNCAVGKLIVCGSCC